MPVPTESEVSAYVGRSGTLPVQFSSGALGIEVRVLDAREAYGRIDILIEPLYGAGSVWVQSHKVELNEER